MKAKTFSIISKIITAVIILVGAILIWLDKFNGEVGDVIKIGIAIYCVLDGTIATNMIVEKVTGRKDGVSVRDKKEQ